MTTKPSIGDVGAVIKSYKKPDGAIKDRNYVKIYSKKANRFLVGCFESSTKAMQYCCMVFGANDMSWYDFVVFSPTGYIQRHAIIQVIDYSKHNSIVLENHYTSDGKLHKHIDQFEADIETLRSAFPGCKIQAWEENASLIKRLLDRGFKG